MLVKGATDYFMGHTVCGWAVLMTPWHGNAIRVIGLLWGGNHRRSVDPLHKGPVMHTFDIHLMLTRIKLLNKHSSCRWSKTPLRSCEIIVMGSIVLFNHWPLEDLIVILKCNLRTHVKFMSTSSDVWNSTYVYAKEHIWFPCQPRSLLLYGPNGPNEMMSKTVTLIDILNT